jgi:hypothetical protein
VSSTDSSESDKFFNIKRSQRLCTLYHHFFLLKNAIIVTAMPAMATHSTG